VRWHWHVSAGEFFELLRPAALIVSALISTWVFASARRRYFALAASLTWAIATFLLPIVVLPIYLIVRAPRKRRPLLATSESDAAATIKFRWLLPIGYAAVLISLVCVYLYRDYASVDAHLARAAQARVMGQHERAIREYRAALQIGEDAHVHKLLGIQLAETRQWGDALNEFASADKGGEPDPSLPFRIAQALDETGRSEQAIQSYGAFLAGPSCTQAVPDERCTVARGRTTR
jgi:tetratricopeptide (TPR) repeat protein